MATYLYQQNVDTQARFTHLSLLLDNGLTARLDLGQTYDLTVNEYQRASAHIVLIPAAGPVQVPYQRVDLPVAGPLTDGDLPSWDTASAAFVPTTLPDRGLITEGDLDSALAAKVNTRVPSGRVGLGTAAAPADIGTGLTVNLLATDDQGQVNLYVKLTANATLSIAGVQLVTWCTIRIFVLQDATGNHTFAVKNLVNNKVDVVTVDLTANASTFTYCYTDDSSSLIVVGPDTSTVVGGGGGTGGGISQPTFTGALGAGNVLTATAPPELLPSTVAWQWQTTTDGTTFTDLVGNGATTNQYTQQAADAGKSITPRVSGTPFARATPQLIPSSNIQFVATAAQTTGTATALHAPAPAGIVAGYLLFVAITIPSGADTTSVAIPGTTGGTDWAPVGPGAGGTVAAGRYYDTASNMVQFIYWKRLGVGDATTTWNFTANASVSYRSRVVAYRNANPTANPPYEGFAQSFGTASTSVTVGAPTATNPNEMELSILGFGGAFNVTWPSTDPTFTAAEGSDYQKFGYRFLSASGAAAAITGTLSGSTRKNIVRLLIIP